VIDVYNRPSDFLFGRFLQLPDVTAKIQGNTIDVHDQPEGLWTGRALQRPDRTAIIHGPQIDFYDQPSGLITGRVFQRPSRTSVVEGGEFNVLNTALGLIGVVAPVLNQTLIERDGHFQFVRSSVVAPTISQENLGVLMENHR
jgi:hypothetical protein